MTSLVKKVARFVLIRIFPSRMGYVIKPKGLGYLIAGPIIKQAAAENLSVGDYLEINNVAGVGERRMKIIEQLIAAGVMNACETIVEIGAGTGMYAEKFLQICKPARYEVYETNVAWARYLGKKYTGGKVAFIVHDADGETLKQTPDNSADLVTAHGVFVYLLTIATFEYLQEAVRVCKTNGYIIFDCFTDRVLTLKKILEIPKKSPTEKWPLIINEQYIYEFCSVFNLQMITTFDVNYHSTKSTYFILKKL